MCIPQRTDKNIQSGTACKSPKWGATQVPINRPINNRRWDSTQSKRPAKAARRRDLQDEFERRQPGTEGTCRVVLFL